MSPSAALHREQLPVTNHRLISYFDAGIADELRASLTDPQRYCPALAGVGWLQGNRLRLRLAQGDLDIVAPKRLLLRALNTCDGQRTVEEILVMVSEAHRAEFAAFLEFLIEQGAVIDAIGIAQQAAGFGFQSSAVGLSAPEELTDALRTRFVPRASESQQPVQVGATVLDGSFSRRLSAITFDDRSIPTAALHAWLWTAAGVVAETHPHAGKGPLHRTVGSAGGMYLVEFFVVLIRPVGDYECGVYVVRYPGQKQLLLEPVSRDISSFHRCFFKPWQLTFATGAVFAAGDVTTGALRYRNRALQYLLLEAGASLQNLSLSAAGLEIGSATVGGYCEDHVAALCGLAGKMVLGSVVFGATATVEQQRLTSKMSAIDFVWANTRGDAYELPFHLARVRLKGKDEKEFNTFGKSVDPHLAYVKAHAETIERQGLREPRNLEVGHLRDFADAQRPEPFVAYQAAQYADASFPFSAFDEKSTYTWKRATDMSSGDQIRVLGELAYSRARSNERWPVSAPRPYTQPSSSGCAAGPTREFALEAALLELVERDAFMRHWLTQKPGWAVLMARLPSPTLRRLSQLRATGCEVAVQKLQSAVAHVALVSATHPVKSFTCVAAAARHDLGEAVDAALDELETSVYTRLIGIDYEPQAPEEVSDPEGHTMLYAQRRYFMRAKAVLTPEAVASADQTNAKSPGLESLLREFSARNLRPVFVDITPEKHHLDQGRTSISVVRALVPSLIPISFGYGREPRAMMKGIHPRSFFPHPFP